MTKAVDKINPDVIPQMQLYTGARMPAIGMGTFGSDRISAQEIADAVKGAAEVEYPHFDCASVYGNEENNGWAPDKIISGGLGRKELWVTSKLWNDKHAEPDIIPSCEKFIADLRLNYVDFYFVHWPFPNYHPPGCGIDERDPNAKPYIHENLPEAH